jgi:alpha/beta superfamily hydrolase
MPSSRINFLNVSGKRLAGIMELPLPLATGKELPKTIALFAHCFTCTKDLKAIVRISRALAKRNIGVLRFDFTGLGDSHGNFSDTNLESNLADIQSACHWLSEHHQAPSLLIGHSLGGAAMMAAAESIPSSRALVTLASPSCTRHLAEFLGSQNPEINSTGSGTVTIGGRTHTIKKQMLDSLRDFDLKQRIQRIHIPHLIMHSPADETLDFRHAVEIFENTAGAKSLITLVDSDHLLVNRADDATYVANLIAVWGSRFLPEIR